MAVPDRSEGVEDLPDALDNALEAVARGRVIEATDKLVAHIDGLLLVGQTALLRRLLARIDTERLPPRVLSGVLMATRAAKTALGEERAGLCERVRRALSGTWGLNPEQAAAILRRHE